LNPSPSRVSPFLAKSEFAVVWIKLSLNSSRV
jgi:hypothetical protein